MKQKRIALFPGCFDPFHLQHHKIVEHLIKDSQLKLDQVWILINADSGEKMISLPWKIRKKMVDQLWAKKETKVKVYSHPIGFYTTDLILQLQKRYPTVHFFLVLGTDQVNNLLNWENLANLKDLIKIITVPRNGFPLNLAVQKEFQIYFLSLSESNNLNSTSIKKGENKKILLHPKTYQTYQRWKELETIFHSSKFDQISQKGEKHPLVSVSDG